MCVGKEQQSEEHFCVVVSHSSFILFVCPLWFIYVYEQTQNNKDQKNAFMLPSSFIIKLSFFTHGRSLTFYYKQHVRKKKVQFIYFKYNFKNWK